MASCHSNSERGGTNLPLAFLPASVGSVIESAAPSSLRLIFPAGPFGISGTNADQARDLEPGQAFAGESLAGPVR